MFRRIVVPLDGSPLAEAVLADVFTLATSAETELVLLAIIPEPSVFAVAEQLQETSFRGDIAVDPDALVPAIEHELTAADEARLGRYLDDLAQRLSADGLRARTQVRIGDAATEIICCTAASPRRCSARPGCPCSSCAPPPRCSPVIAEPTSPARWAWHR
jgi:hypothetical protein